MKIGGCPLVCITLRWVPLYPPEVRLSQRYAVPESSYFQESCSGRLHRRQSLRTCSVQQQSLLIETLLKKETAAQHHPRLPRIRCWSLLSVVTRTVILPPLLQHPSFLRRHHHYDMARCLHLGLLLFQLLMVGILQPSGASHLVQQLCLSCGDEPPVTFILWVTVSLICFFLLFSVFDFLCSLHLQVGSGRAAQPSWVCLGTFFSGSYTPWWWKGPHLQVGPIETIKDQDERLLHYKVSHFLIKLLVDQLMVSWG